MALKNNSYFTFISPEERSNILNREKLIFSLYGTPSQGNFDWICIEFAMFAVNVCVDT